MYKKSKNFSGSLLFAILGTISLNSWAQLKETYIPSSPEAAALSKSINFPVGTNTGVPSISIPLHTVEADGLAIPLAINYHAGGFKINEQSGNVGLGWSLNIELEITRQINGLDDFFTTSYTQNNGYYSNDVRSYDQQISAEPEPDVYKFLDIVEGKIDYQPDRFQFKLLNKSGTFYFQKKLGSPTTIVTVPTEDIIIQPITSNPALGFKITDIDGTMYWFDVDERTVIHGATASSPNGEYQTTAWKCSKIVSPSKTDTLKFTYIPKAKQYYYDNNEKIEVFDDTDPCLGQAGQPIIYYPPMIDQALGPNATKDDVLGQIPMYQLAAPRYIRYSYGQDAGLYIHEEALCDECTEFEYKHYEGGILLKSIRSVEGLAIESIKFNRGKIEFSGTNHLESISIRNNKNELVKNIRLVQDHIPDPYQNSYIFNGEQTSEGTFYLDSLIFTDNFGEGEQEKYSFQYIDKYCFNNHTKGSDPWGAVNGSTIRDLTLSVTSVPGQDIPAIQNNCVDRSFPILIGGSGSLLPEESGMKHGILQRITYPTGGYTQFSFSPNYFKTLSGASRIAGGLRVEQMSYYDGKNPEPAWEKIYKYGQQEDGTGKLKSAPSIDYLEYGITSFESYSYEQNHVYLKDNGAYMLLDWADPNSWHKLNENYDVDYEERQRTYLPNAINSDLFYIGGAPIHYIEVAEYQKDLGVVTGKTVFQFDESSYSGYNPAYVYPNTNISVKQSDWHMGKLKAEIHFKYNGNGFDTLKIKKYNYFKYVATDKIFVGKVFMKTVGKLRPLQLPPSDDSDYTEGDFTFLPYPLETGNVFLEKEEEIWKEGDKRLSKITDYTYSSLLHQQPTNIFSKQSDGQTIEKRIRFAPDYAAPSTFVKNLEDNHMFSSPVEQVTILGSNVVSGQITTYKTDGSGLIDKVYAIETANPVPASQFSYSEVLSDVFTTDSRYKEKYSFVYDNANPVMVLKPDNAPVSYVWGHKKTLPIAQAINAKNDQIYFNGFEEDGSAVLGNAHSGNSAKLSSYTINFSPPAGSTYYVTYWTFSNGIWQFSGEQPYSNGYIINADLIDDIRVYPKGSMMTTYTYLPLVGITSSTDSNNITTHYEYDGLGRLKNIKDHKYNILKTYTYHYRK